MMRVVPMAVDLLFVLIFAAVGRASHGLGVLGILSTAWPFLLACIAAWIVVAAIGDQGYGLRAPLIVTLVTWLGGIAIRLLTGDSAEGGFVAVAGLFLATCFFGWRLIRWLVWGRRRAAQ